MNWEKNPSNARAVYPHLQRIRSRVEQLGHFGIGLSFDVLHHERLTLFRGERIERSFNCLAQLGPLQPTIATLAARHIDAVKRDMLPAPPGVMALVRDNPEEPGLELLRIPARRQRVERPNERFLHRISRRVRIPTQ